MIQMLQTYSYTYVTYFSSVHFVPIVHLIIDRVFVYSLHWNAQNKTMMSETRPVEMPDAIMPYAPYSFEFFSLVLYLLKSSYEVVHHNMRYP